MTWFLLKSSTTRSERSSAALRFHSSSQLLLQNIITQKLYNLPADYWDTYPQKVSAITAQDVQKAAQKYIDLGHLQVVAVALRKHARYWRSMERLNCTTLKENR